MAATLYERHTIIR